MHEQISQRTTVTKIDKTKIIDGTNDEIAGKESAVRKFISAALGSAGSGSFISDDTLPRRPFSFGKVRPHKLVLSCNDICIQSTIHAVEDTFIAPIATTSDFIPSKSSRITLESAQLLSNECDYAQSSDEIPSTDCSFLARSQAQEDCVLSDPFVKTSLDISSLGSFYRPSFFNDTADVIGDNLIVITSEKLNSSEMLMLNDDTSIFLLRHYKSFWTGLTSNDERNFYKPTRPSTNAVGGHSNTHVPNPINIPQQESQPVCTSKLDDIRKDAFTSDITREMIAQTEFSASSAIVPYCEPLIRSFLRLDLTRSTEVPALFSTEMAYQSHESNLHSAMIQNNFDSLSQNSIRLFVERNRMIMSPHNVDFGRKEAFNLISPIFVNHLFEHCDDQMTAPSIRMALVPFEDAPSRETGTADSIAACVVDSTTYSTTNSTTNSDEQS